MPIRPPALDDRNFDDLVEELLTRIPAHTPEYRNPRPGDPGRTLIELFAWLADTILYRANLIPERQRLVFLERLGIQLQPALPASGIVTVSFEEKTLPTTEHIRTNATINGPVPFETRGELTVLPITTAAYYKRKLTLIEKNELSEVVEGLRTIYGLGENDNVTEYITTPVFPEDQPDPKGFDLLADTVVDGSLWLALLAPSEKSEDVESARKTLGSDSEGGQKLLNIGIIPAIQVPELFEQIGPRARIPHIWEISTISSDNSPAYIPLRELLQGHSTNGFTKPGVERLVLPANPAVIQAPTNNVAENISAGVGDLPPRLDDREKAARLITWIRLRADAPIGGPPVKSLKLSWIGINAVKIEQRQTTEGQIAGVSDGSGNQQFQLSSQSIDPDSLQLQIEENERGYQLWTRVDAFSQLNYKNVLEGREFTLDSEAGVIQFGDGAYGRIPEPGARIRVAHLQAGGGREGNLPAGTLKDISAVNLQGAQTTKLIVHQPLRLEGGEDAETLEKGERRIPEFFRHRDRAVTENDYNQLAKETPSIDVSRVEVLPRFKPHQRRPNVPGVVSVMVWPNQLFSDPPNPRPDRLFLEAIHAHLDQRRPLSTELYVIGCEYVALGLGIALSIRDGFEQTMVVHDVKQTLRRLLWPLKPFGPTGEGWPLGTPIRDRELEVEVSRVPGVNSVFGINLFERLGNQWRQVTKEDECKPLELSLEDWQLPELLSVVIVVGNQEDICLTPPTELPPGLFGDSTPSPSTGTVDIAVPVIPEVC